jgi:hypothetical protein
LCKCFNNLVKNNITALGIRQFVPMQFLQLHDLYLGFKYNNSADNHIGSYGAKFLSKTKIPALEKLWIYNILII